MTLKIDNATVGYDQNNLQQLLNDINTNAVTPAISTIKSKANALNTTIDTVWVGASADAFKSKVTNDTTALCNALNDLSNSIQSQINTAGSNVEEIDAEIAAQLFGGYASSGSSSYSSTSSSSSTSSGGGGTGLNKNILYRPEKSNLLSHSNNKLFQQVLTDLTGGDGSTSPKLDKVEDNPCNTILDKLGIGRKDSNGNTKAFSYSQVFDDGYDCQGFTYAGDYMVVSCYKEGESERLYYYDKKTGDYMGCQDLGINGHAGGTTYDSQNGILYVTEKGNKISAYDYNALLQNAVDGKSGESAYLGYVELPVDESKAATITYNNGTLYACTYSNDGASSGIGYTFDVSNVNTSTKANSDNKLSVDATSIYQAPRQIQGVASTTYNGKDYELYAQSSKGADSSIVVYEVNNDGSKTYLGKYWDEHEGLEGIQVVNGNLMGIYEYGNHNTSSVTMKDVLDNTTKDYNTKSEVTRNLGDIAEDVRTGWSNFTSSITGGKAKSDYYTYSDMKDDYKNDDDVKALME